MVMASAAPPRFILRPKVAIVRCDNYDQAKVNLAVREAVCLALGPDWQGGLREPVLVKPNALNPRRPETGVCTHPSVLAAVISLLREAGAQSIIVGDSSGGSGVKPSITAKALEVSGLAGAARTLGATVRSFDQGEAISVPNPRGQEFRPLALSRTAVEAARTGWLVSVPKLKTHALTILTAAIKNLFGTVPGAAKRETHRQNPSIEEFSDALVDIAAVLPANLHVVDAIWAMEGEGPSGGSLVNLGVIVAGADPVAVDAVLAAIVGIAPSRVPTTRLGAARGLGEADLSRIEIAGVPLAEIKVRRFRLPIAGALARYAPRGLTRAGVSLVTTRPAFLRAKCTQCGICAGSCPVKALEVGKAQPIPDLDERKCISCFCCHELCPSQAVYVEWKHPLSRLLFRRAGRGGGVR
jgi:uncharacterized protein (DUF362 family)/NAD-dependent dihydropyrimidine dehydrogenase PreA subunit